jgi:hypothetical protein
MEDGNWYRMGQPDGNGTYFDFDTADTDYINNWPMHTWYNLAIRRDWLDDCGLAMPETTDAFYDTLIAFQDNDCNGTGARDERAYLGIGSPDASLIFCNGVSQWFGSRFQTSPWTPPPQYRERP